MVQGGNSRSEGKDEDKKESAFQQYQEGEFYNMTAEVGVEGERDLRILLFNIKKK